MVHESNCCGVVAVDVGIILSVLGLFFWPELKEPKYGRK